VYAQEQAMPAGPYLRRMARSTPIQPSDEIRALWVVRDALTTPEDIDRCIDLAIQTRFHILFVQVRGRGDAYYQSALEPPALDLKYTIDDFDPLEYLLARTRATGISVHAWINVFYVWSNGALDPPEGHVVRTHPEWLATNAEGVRMDERPVDDWKAAGLEGYFVSPFSAQARAHLASVVRDLVDTYPVDGIHLDYIRYPGPEYGFDRGARTRFALEWGVDPVELRSDAAGLSAVMGAEATASLDSVWTGWRAQQVDSTVMAVRGVVGDLPVSAAVVPEPQAARVDKGQDWPEWLRRRWVDFVVPMAYNHRPEELLDWVRILHNTIGRERMLVGLAIYGGRDAYVERSVNILRVDRAFGFSVFSYNVLAEMRFAANFVEQVFFAGHREETDEQVEPDEQGEEIEENGE
jgi:uncharacterized lipoprotein YddW (UPF0748 family)